MADDPKHSERRDGPTPNGGHHSVAYFSDAQGNPCPKEKAARIEIHENDVKGNSIHRTHLQLGEGDHS